MGDIWVFFPPSDSDQFSTIGFSNVGGNNQGLDEIPRSSIGSENVTWLDETPGSSSELEILFDCNLAAFSLLLSLSEVYLTLYHIRMSPLSAVLYLQKEQFILHVVHDVSTGTQNGQNKHCL